MSITISEHENFVRRERNVADALQNLREEAKRLIEIWNSKSISSDPNFQDAFGISTVDQTSMITMMQDIVLFTENGVAPQGDRVSIIARLLASEA